MASHMALASFERLPSELRAAHACAAILGEAGSVESPVWLFSKTTRPFTPIEMEVARHLAAKHPLDPIVSAVCGAVRNTSWIVFFVTTASAALLVLLLVRLQATPKRRLELLLAITDAVKDQERLVRKSARTRKAASKKCDCEDAYSDFYSGAVEQGCFQ